MRTVRFPDAISSVDIAADDTIAVGCWNHKVYLLDESGHPLAALPEGLDVGAASLVRASKIAPGRFAVATTAGIVLMLDAARKKAVGNKSESASEAGRQALDEEPKGRPDRARASGAPMAAVPIAIWGARFWSKRPRG